MTSVTMNVTHKGGGSGEGKPIVHVRRYIFYEQFRETRENSRWTSSLHRHSLSLQQLFGVLVSRFIEFRTHMQVKKIVMVEMNVTLTVRVPYQRKQRKKIPR